MSGSNVINSRQNAHLNRDRQLAPIHIPSGTIPDADPLKLSIPQGVARDIILENVGDVTLSFTFFDPDSHPIGDNLWKSLAPGAVFSSYCNFRDFWVMGEGASYEVVLNAEGTISFSEVKIVDPTTVTVGVFKQLISDEALVTNQTATPITVISEVVPMGKKWYLGKARFVCRSFGKFSVYLDGDRIGLGVTSSTESNVIFDDWEESLKAMAGQTLEVIFVQSNGPVTDLATVIGYTEQNI